MANMSCLLLFAWIMVPSVLAATTLVDVTGPGCDNLDGYYLKNIDDYISIYAYPQYNTIATRDHCDVTVRADVGRRIEYIIENIIFNECGVEIFMYDNPTIDTNPIKIVTCNDNSKVPLQGKTNYNVFRLRVRKTTPESRAFTFSMRLKNDLGPPMQFEKDSASYTGEVLEPSAIVGIAVAGGVVLIAAIGIAVFMCFHARSSSWKKQKYPSDDKAVSVHSSKPGAPTSVSQNKYSHHSSSSQNHPSSSSQKQYSPQLGSSEKQYSHHASSSQKQYSPHASSSQKQYSHVSSISHKEGVNQWGMPQEDRPPRRTRPSLPMPTQPSQRDPSRKGLSDRHRSGEHEVRPSSQSRNTNRKVRETFA